MERSLIFISHFLFLLAAGADAKGAGTACTVETGSGEMKTFSDCATEDARGALRLSPRIQASLAFDKEGLSGLYVGKACYWTNRAGTLRRTFCFDNGPDYFSEGLARYIDGDGHFGFMNRKLEIVIPPRFDFANPFKNGKAEFCNGCKPKADGEHFEMVGGTWGTIDRSGHVVPGRGSE